MPCIAELLFEVPSTPCELIVELATAFTQSLRETPPEDLSLARERALKEMGRLLPTHPISEFEILLPTAFA